MRHLFAALLLIPALAFAADAAAEAPAKAVNCDKCAAVMVKCPDCTAAKAADPKVAACAKCLAKAKECADCKKAAEKTEKAAE